MASFRNQIDEIKKNKDQSSQNIIRAEEESDKINKELKKVILLLEEKEKLLNNLITN